MKKIFNRLTIFTLAAIVFACSTEDDLVEDWIEVNEVDPADPGNAGSLDFSNYVAIGNSLTAGFADGALYTAAQEKSFPNQLASQFALVDTDVSFSQPDINSENGFNSSASDIGAGVIRGRFVLALDVPGPAPLCEGELPTAFAGDKSTLNNFGVPGIIAAQLLIPNTGTPGDPFENSLYTRFASAPGTSTILGDAVATDPSFFSLWIGNNDVLGYAVTGGDGSVAITDAATLGGQFQSIIDALKADPGVVMTIPPVLLTPFFRAITWDAVEFDETDATDAANIAALNDLAAYGGYNAALDGLAAAMAITQEEADARKVVFGNGTNGIAMIDENLADIGTLLGGINPALAGFGQVRQSNATDLIPLGASSSLLAGVGTQTLAGDALVLTPEEQAEINQAVTDFNTQLATIITTENAGGADIALVDVTGTFFDLFGVSDGELGIEVDGVTLSPDFTPNGIFSNDAIHGNPRGNAIIANLIIDTINERWNASIPTISVLEELGVEFVSVTPDCSE